MRVAVLTKPFDGCCYYRLVLPLDYMPWGEGDVVKTFYPNKASLEGKNREVCGHIAEIDSFNPDIIFFNRNLIEKDLHWLATQKKKGVKIILDIDDFWELSPSHPTYSYWYKYDINNIIKETIKLADLVLTTNDRLKQVIKPLNKNCEVIPNAVPFGDPHFLQDKEAPRLPKMNFLYAGGSSHFQDVSLLKNKFERIGSDPSIKDNAVFSLAGFDPLPSGHCQWDRMASIFKRTKSYQILNTLPIQTHMTFYDTADVVLVPLVKNEFNQYKSILKIIEAATRELPCIVSKVPPYSDLQGIPGILWENWKDNIKYCLNNRNFVLDKGKELAEKIKEDYDLKHWAKTRYELFKNIIK